MGRTQRALTSLVAAIPAAFLTYLLVMVFLNSADSLKPATQAVAGATLLLSALVTLMPFGLLVLGGKKAATPDNAAASKGSARSDDEGEDIEVADEDDVEITDDEAEDLAETSDFDLDDSDADIMSDSSGEIESGPASSLDEMDAFDMEDEEPKPKKKKK